MYTSGANSQRRASEMLRHVASYKLADVSEVLTAAIVVLMGVKKHL
jgi:hypothetical protein